ncbi:MAG: hypothetical protein JWN04_89 [Myxococcaceae bacterium]|nr:hypothetical protein [Myxococcaceae bacterium]
MGREARREAPPVPRSARKLLPVAEHAPQQAVVDRDVDRGPGAQVLEAADDADDLARFDDYVDFVQDFVRGAQADAVGPCAHA